MAGNWTTLTGNYSTTFHTSTMSLKGSSQFNSTASVHDSSTAYTVPSSLSKLPPQLPGAHPHHAVPTAPPPNMVGDARDASIDGSIHQGDSDHGDFLGEWHRHVPRLMRVLVDGDVV